MLCSAILAAIVVPHQTWVGMIDLQNEGTFVWIDGVQSTQENSNWGHGQPDNAFTTEDCAEMHEPLVPYDTLNDSTCSIRQRALCEKEITV